MLQGVFLALFFFFPLSVMGREEVEAAMDTPEVTEDSRERSGGLVSPVVFLALFFLFLPWSSAMVVEVLEAAPEASDASDASWERSSGGGGVGDLGDLGGSSSTSSFFCGLLGFSTAPSVRCCLLLGTHVASSASTEVMRPSGKVADYIGTAGMRSSSAIHTLAIRRVHRPYAGHTLFICQHTLVIRQHTVVLRCETLVIR